MIGSFWKANELHPVWREPIKEILELLDKHGVGGTLYTVYRSPQEQERRFKLGETNARAGESAHNVIYQGRPAALAFDFVVHQGENSQLQRELQEWWAALGLSVIRGGVGPNRVPDPSHVEAPNWRAIASAYPR